MTETHELDTKLFSPVKSFLEFPASLVLENVRAAIVGVPFDMGVAPVRVGSRLGPAAIREQSEILDIYDPMEPDLDLYDTLNPVDCGDIVVWPGEREKSWENIEQAVAQIAAAGTVPVSFGGDGSVSFPQARALSKHHDGLVLLHFDAHTDVYPPPEQGAHTTGTTFTYAAMQGLFDTERSFHIGPRGPVSTARVFDHTRSFGYRIIPDADLLRRGSADVIAEVKATIGNRPVYLCWDMDFYDPSCAPAVCNPTWGGITAREGFELVRALSDINIVAVDINTVSPPHDANGMTALLAGQTALECLFVLARNLGAVQE